MNASRVVRIAAATGFGRRALAATAMALVFSTAACSGDGEGGSAERANTVVAPGAEETPNQTQLPLSDLFAKVHGWIVYRSNGQIIAIDPTNPENALSFAAGEKTEPIDWSPDGSRLLVRRYREGGCGGPFGVLYVMGANGSETRLSRRDCSVSGSFSPDGTMVAYDDDFDLYVIDANGSTRRLLASSDAGSAWLGYPTWSPDGSRIAFLSSAHGGDSFAISVMKPNGTGRRVLIDLGMGSRVSALPSEIGLNSGGVAWSPDGSRLLFSARAHPYRGHIYVVGANGSGLRQIANGGGWPSWSPDGSRIAFVRGHELFTMAPDGSHVRRVDGGLLPHPSGGWHAQITWNPIG